MLFHHISFEKRVPIDISRYSNFFRRSKLVEKGDIPLLSQHILRHCRQKVHFPRLNEWRFGQLSIKNIWRQGKESTQHSIRSSLITNHFGWVTQKMWQKFFTGLFPQENLYYESVLTKMLGILLNGADSFLVYFRMEDFSAQVFLWKKWARTLFDRKQKHRRFVNLSHSYIEVCLFLSCLFFGILSHPSSAVRVAKLYSIFV